MRSLYDIVPEESAPGPKKATVELTTHKAALCWRRHHRRIHKNTECVGYFAKVDINRWKRRTPIQLDDSSTSRKNQPSPMRLCRTFLQATQTLQAATAQNSVSVCPVLCSWRNVDCWNWVNWVECANPIVNYRTLIFKAWDSVSHIKVIKVELCECWRFGKAWDWKLIVFKRFLHREP